MAYRRKVCAKCPFRRDVKPYLRPERAEEIAYASQNPYSDFACHETLDHDVEGDTIATDKSLTCAGFFAMQVNYAIEAPDGYEWPGDVYCEPEEMIDAYTQEWER